MFNKSLCCESPSLDLLKIDCPTVNTPLDGHPSMIPQIDQIQPAVTTRTVECSAKSRIRLTIVILCRFIVMRNSTICIRLTARCHKTINHVVVTPPEMLQAPHHLWPFGRLRKMVMYVEATRMIDASSAITNRFQEPWAIPDLSRSMSSASSWLLSCSTVIPRIWIHRGVKHRAQSPFCIPWELLDECMNERRLEFRDCSRFRREDSERTCCRPFQ